jgi:type IV fimbrial biogenesis protein FimT
MRRPRRSDAGLTLVEILVTLALMAALATLTLPSFGQMIDRHRLISAAETLAADLAQARFEAARAGQPLHVVFRAGSDWCYAVALAPACACDQPQPCQLKTVRAADLPGIRLRQAADAHFDPAALSTVGGRASFESDAGEPRLSVGLTALGRARVCSPSGLRGYPACPDGS